MSKKPLFSSFLKPITIALDVYCRAVVKEKIFERGLGKNTGTGMALSREIHDITGITIRETGEPGKGARFEMVVPKGAWRKAG